MPSLLRHFIFSTVLVHTTACPIYMYKSTFTFKIHLSCPGLWYNTIKVQYATTTFSLQYWTGKKIKSVGSSLVLKCIKSSKLIICILKYCIVLWREQSHLFHCAEHTAPSLSNIILFLMSKLVNGFFLQWLHQSHYKPNSCTALLLYFGMGYCFPESRWTIVLGSLSLCCPSWSTCELWTVFKSLHHIKTSDIHIQIISLLLLLLLTQFTREIQFWDEQVLYCKYFKNVSLSSFLIPRYYQLDQMIGIIVHEQVMDIINVLKDFSKVIYITNHIPVKKYKII